MASHFNTQNIDTILNKVQKHELYSIIGFGSRVQYQDPEEVKQLTENIYNDAGGFDGKNPVFIYNGDPSNDGSIGIAYAKLSELMKSYGGFLIMTQIEEAKNWGVDENMFVEEPVLYVPTSNNAPKQCKYGGIDFKGQPNANTKSIVEINRLRIENGENSIKKIYVIGDKLYDNDVLPCVSVIAHFERNIFTELGIELFHIFATAKNKNILEKVQGEIEEIESQIS